MSTKTIAEKLLIKPDTAIWSSHASRLNLIDPLPEGVRVVDSPDQATIGLVFADDANSVRDILTEHQGHLTHLSILCVAYPKANRHRHQS